MALPATEAFTDSDGVQLTTHSASWTLNSGDFDILNNRLRVDDAGNEVYIAAHWNADSFNDNQYAEMTSKLQTNNQWHYLGVSVRCAAAANTFYSVVWADDDANRKILSKVVAGSRTAILNAFGSAWSADAVLRLEAEGTTLRVYDDEVQEGGDQTDAAIASGYAGVGGWHWSGGDPENTLYDDWEGGNLAGAAGQPISLRSTTVPHSRRWHPGL